MNQPMHTPGPWREEDGQIFGYEPSVENEVMICDIAPENAALTHFDLHNARLIAAAPDLLAALQQVLRDVPDVIRNAQMSYVQDAIDKALGQ